MDGCVDAQDRPEAASALSVTWGALQLLETLMMSSDAEVVRVVQAKLRSVGTQVFRYVLDHPKVMLTGMLGSGSAATKVAALVWGRDEDVSKQPKPYYTLGRREEKRGLLVFCVSAALRYSFVRRWLTDVDVGDVDMC